MAANKARKEPFEGNKFYQTKVKLVLLAFKIVDGKFIKSEGDFVYKREKFNACEAFKQERENPQNSQLSDKKIRLALKSFFQFERKRESDITQKIYPGEIYVQPTFFHNTRKQIYIARFIQSNNGIELFDHIGQLIEQNKLSESECLQACLKLACALKVVHDKGYAHRDIKPDNILVNPKTEVFKIIDFGRSLREGKLPPDIFLKYNLLYPPNTYCYVFWYDLSLARQLYGDVENSLKQDDIYSLALVMLNTIAYLEGENAIEFFDKYIDDVKLNINFFQLSRDKGLKKEQVKQFHEEIVEKLHETIYKIFAILERSSVNPVVLNKMQDLLIDMTQLHPGKRCDIDTVSACCNELKELYENGNVDQKTIFRPEQAKLL